VQFFFIGEVVAQIKFTVLMMPNGPMKITGVPLDLSIYESEHQIENEELKVCSICLPCKSWH